jgi:hypothetical protein
MKKLYHGQQIRTTVDKYQPTIFIYSIEGCAKAHNENESLAYEKEIKRSKETGTRAQTAFVLQDPPMLTADYPGKHEKMQLEKKSYNESVLVENREIIEIENRKYRVEYTRPCCCDPIILIEVDNV